MAQIVLLFTALLLFSCNGPKSNAGGKPVIRPTPPPAPAVKNINSIAFGSPAGNSTHSYNDKIDIRLVNHKNIPADSVQLFYNNRHIATLGKDTLTGQLTVPADKPGNNTLRLVAFHGREERSVDARAIVVKPDNPPVRYAYEIRNTYPHDPHAYTQGLVYHKGYLYEGTGQYGKSELRKTTIPDGKVTSVLSIGHKLFGEGITIYRDKIYQLTWTSHQGFVYDLNSFSLEATFTYNTQGWGITTVGDVLIMSDGSHKLYRIAPGSFAVIGEVEVFDHNGPVANLNELEYIDGRVWANIWTENRIVMIDPESGEVTGELDMTALLPRADWSRLDKRDEVLNGIAWNPERETVYLTGKHWPKLFEITVISPIK